jgi:hypothetical protein
LDQVVVTWNGAGQDPPLANIHLDAIPQFELWIFDYSGAWDGDTSPDAPPNAPGIAPARSIISKRTECKGQILDLCALQLSNTPEPIHKKHKGRTYIAIIDDDILIGISDINRALHLGRRLDLTTFSPSLSRDSFFNHAKMLAQPGRLAHQVDWVEIMMPFIDKNLFLASQRFYPNSISSWGIDCFVYPYLAIAHQLGDRHAVLDSVVASHIRPVTSGDRRFSNGLTAHEELRLLRSKCLTHLKSHWPDLIEDARIRRLFDLDPAPSRNLQRLKKLIKLPETARAAMRKLMATENDNYRKN